MKNRTTLDVLLAKAGAQARRKRPSEEEFTCKREQNGACSCSAKRSRKCGDAEHRLQAACIRWFTLAYPELYGRLFAVPNGGRRDMVTGAKLKAEGVLPGVADLILLVRRGGYGALLIEMKTAKGRQSDSQRWWQQAVTAGGEYKYVVCRSLDDFMREVKEYMRVKNEK